ncbi:MAG: DUF4157 domain-containing protein [Chitinophagaceae bacterium]
MKIKENAFVARIAARKLKSRRVAITIGKTIYLYNTTKEDFLADERWLRHEMQHIRQFRRYGLLRFSVMYLWETMRHGYHDNKWEKEARDAEDS